MTARNRAILWLLRDTGLSVSELYGLRLGDVDRAGGTVTVHRKRGRLRVFPLSADGRHAVCAYLEQARLTPAWTSVVPEARDLLLLTERRHPLTKNSLTLLFLRLSQRAGFAREPICPSMLRDTYAIRFLRAGGELAALQEQLGVADLASVQWRLLALLKASGRISSFRHPQRLGGKRREIELIGQISHDVMRTHQ